MGIDSPFKLVPQTSLSRGLRLITQRQNQLKKLYKTADPEVIAAKVRMISRKMRLGILSRSQKENAWGASEGRMISSQRVGPGNDPNTYSLPPRF